MNKKILTKVISFVLVICMLVPVIPNLGLDLASVTADAAMPTPSSSAILFKTGSRYYWKSGTTDTQIPVVDGVQPKPLYSAGSYFLPVGIVNTLTGANLTATAEFYGVGYIKVTHGGTVTGSWKTYISNMGFIQLTTGSDTISSASDSEQETWIKDNVFDHTTYNSTAFSASSMQTTDHPYLLTNQAEFDYLHAVYTGSAEDATLKSYLDYLVNDALAAYNKYSTKDTTDGALNSTYKDGGTNPLSTMTNGKYGYDSGGRQGDSVGIATYIEKLAYAYQVTRDTKYSNLALNMSLALAKWPHWGTGHFLNAADTSYHMALVFDWCYDVWGNTTERNTVRDALFTKGVMAGIYSSLGEEATYTSGSILSKTTNNYNPQVWYNNVLQGGGERYIQRENNWNGVCSSGMILASLALMSEEGDVSNLTITAINSSGTQTVTKIFEIPNISYKYNSSTKTYKFSDALSANGTSTSGINTYKKASAFLINNNLHYLEKNGLAQYVPDGSYIESASYWVYGTNSIFRTIAALESTCGYDFGLSAAMGFDKTAYYSYYAQSSNGDIWRYHDDNSSTLDTGMNALYGSIIGDENLVGYRKYLLEKGAAYPTHYDTFSYDASITGFDKTALDYYMEGIEGYTMRSSWEDDATYVAFMGGSNYVNHGQIDSGAFVYHNNGVTWFQDVGTEEYNAKGFGYGTKTIEGGNNSSSGTMYYPITAEGNNTLATSKYRFGQNWSSSNPTATIEKHGSNEYGAYAILDQSNIYGVSGAKRGILMTNDRKTVVIQDEVNFGSSQNSYWIGHVLDTITITVSADGKTAYLTDGNTTIRCTLVTGSGDYKFSVEDITSSSYSAHFSSTAAANYSADQGKTPQRDLSGWQKLVVACEGASNIQLAVVIEEVAVGDNYECGYTWTSMSNWGTATLKPDSNNYDGKVLLSKDFDIEGIGSFSAKTGNLRISNTRIDGDNAMGAYYFDGNNNAANITLSAAAGKVAHASLGKGMLVAEFDLKTLGKLPDEANISIYGTDIYPIVSVSASELGDPTDWAHVTMVIDEDTDTFYVYLNDECVVEKSFVSSSYEGLKLVISTENGSVTSGTSLLIDNVVIRTFTETYTELDSVLNGSVDISNWSDTSYVQNTETGHTGAVAYIYTKEVTAPAPDNDTPVVDFWGTGTVVLELEPQAALITDGGVEVNSFEELQQLINAGGYTNVDLYTGNTTPITISNKIVVDTNGYEFYALSDNLICQVAGDIHTYKAGSIKVAFVINGATTYVTYTNTTYASYQVAASALGVIREGHEGDLYHYVVTKQNTWALEDAGDAVMGNALIITSANSRFYLTGDPYTGAFVTVSGNTITGYTVANQFLTIMANSNSYDRVSLTSDMYVNSNDDGSVANAVRGTKNVYLNGFTLTYYSSVQSDHMFTIGSANITLNVYGPGVLDMDAIEANLIMRTEANCPDTTFNNLTIQAQHVITDQREGTIVFNNCNISIETNKQVLKVSNRSADATPGTNNNNGTIDPAQMGVLVINGGVISTTGTGDATLVHVMDNSRLVLKGGVVLNAPNAKAAILIYHANKTMIEGESGVEHMYVHLGEYYLGANTKLYAYVNGRGETSLTDDQLKSHFYRIEGAGFATEATDYTVAAGYTLAKTGVEGYAYKVVKNSDVATVVWSANGKTVTEYWLAGTTPVASGAAKTNLGTAATGSKNTYDLSSLGGHGVRAGKTYTFSAITAENLSIKMGMNLYGKFEVVIYVEQADGIEYVKINGERKSLGDYTKFDDKTYYAFVIDVAAFEATDSIVVSVKRNGKEITAVTSVVNYAAKVLAGGESATTKKLLYSVVEYIGASAAYSGDKFTSESCKALLANYSAYATDTTMAAKAPNTSAVKDAIKSAYLELGTENKFAFKFNSNYTGTVTFSYTGVKGKVTKTVYVENGKVDGSDVYLLTMRAYDMASDITITTAGGSCVYSIDAYYTMAVSAEDALYDLICTLNAYCENAKAYMNQ